MKQNLESYDQNLDIYALGNVDKWKNRKRIGLTNSAYKIILDMRLYLAGQIYTKLQMYIAEICTIYPIDVNFVNKVNFMPPFFHGIAFHLPVFRQIYFRAKLRKSNQKFSKLASKLSIVCNALVETLGYNYLRSWQTVSMFELLVDCPQYL